RPPLGAPLLGALGAQAAVAVEPLPALAALIGAPPPLPAVGPLESANRTRLTLQILLQALASAERPLIMFIDDLQWADSASLALLERLVSAPDRHHLLVVGAVRAEEADAAAL